MGIKYFFKWFKTNHSESITCIDRRAYNTANTIDVLLIDMNGIIHNSAQRVYGYGSFSIPEENACDKKVYASVCLTIDRMVRQFKPQELVLCIDGVAPMSKQIQQRQRRFLAAHDRRTPGSAFDFDSNKGNVSSFDSNAISPGTEFMHDLGRYIDIYIKKKQKSYNTTRPHVSATETTEETWRTPQIQNWRSGGQTQHIRQEHRQEHRQDEWSNMTVIFANDKVAGEGEHKLLNYIRKYGKQNLNYCIYGSDADLIMLSMSALTTSAIRNIYVLRDEYKSPNYLLIDIPFFIDNLIRDVKRCAKGEENWNGEFSRLRFIDDFIFMCFMVGNDFLPHIPSIEIMTNGIESMLNIYVKHKNHITHSEHNGVVFDHNALLPILKDLEKLEQNLCNIKVNDSAYFTDELLESCITNTCLNNNVQSPPTDRDMVKRKIFYSGNDTKKPDEEWTPSTSLSITNSFWAKIVDVEEYRKKYMTTHFDNGGFDASVMYLEGMQWVLSYYTLKVPNWSWSYKYDYAPNLTSLIEALSFKKKKVRKQDTSLVARSRTNGLNANGSNGYKKDFEYKLFPIQTNVTVAIKQHQSGHSHSGEHVLRVDDTEFNDNMNALTIRPKSMTETNICISNEAIPPFHQLLFILPPDSSGLLPYPLNEAFFNELKIYAPKELIIDRAGKRQEWEGIVLLPKLDQKIVSDCYLKYKPHVTNKKDLARDIKGKTFKYQHGEASFLN